LSYLKGGDSLKEMETYNLVSSHAVATSPHTPQQLQKWNPMESDFFADRNSYAIDDEDTTSALHGYSKASKCDSDITSNTIS